MKVFLGVVKPLLLMYNRYERDKAIYGTFRPEDWEADKIEYLKGWEGYKEQILEDKPNSEPIFNIKPNLIDSLRPFINKRGVRNRLFKGNEHEVKVVQLEQIPGSARLIYRDLDRCVSVMEPVYISSIKNAKDDLTLASKKLFKKAKKL